MEAQLPFNLDLELHIQNNPIDHSQFPNGFNFDHAKYLLTQITEAPALNNVLEDEMINGYVPLSSDFLQNKVPNYKRYLDYFERSEVIDINHRYRPSTFFPDDARCKSYRFAKKYQGEIWSVAYSQPFEKRLIASQKKNIKADRKEYWHLIKWLMPEENKLQIDFRKAEAYMRLKRKAQYKNPDLKDIKIINGQQKRKRPKDQHKHALFNILAIRKKDGRCKIDEVAGRMHTVLTNIKSDLRNLITYDGKPLVSIDITNSQPYFASLLIDPKFYERSGRETVKQGLEAVGRVRRKGKQKKIKVKQIKEEIRSKLTHDTLMSLYGSQTIDSESINLYKLIVSDSGFQLEGFEVADIYNLILAESRRRNDRYSFATRPEVKIGMFEILFSKNKRRTKAKKLFAEIFPEMSRLFEWIKEGPNTNDHTRLACLLQNIESVAILKIVTKEIATLYPKMPMYTIHDSIVVPALYKNEVRELMSEILEELVGLRPKLTIDAWCPSNLDKQISKWNDALL